LTICSHCPNYRCTSTHAPCTSLTRYRSCTTLLLRPTKKWWVIDSVGQVSIHVHVHTTFWQGASSLHGYRYMQRANMVVNSPGCRYFVPPRTARMCTTTTAKLVETTKQLLLVMICVVLGFFLVCMEILVAHQEGRHSHLFYRSKHTCPYKKKKG
jgi:hypothetical protein